MNTIKIYLAESGSLAELRKDFPLYQQAFNNKLLNIYVPTSLLDGVLDTQYIESTGFVHTEAGTFTALKIGSLYVKDDGRTAKSTAFYARYLKTLVYNGIEYALYERKLPQPFTMYAGSGETATKLIINVVNMQNNNVQDGDEVIIVPPTILQVITSQTCSLDILQSSNLDQDETYDAGELEVLSGEINDLYEKYDYITNVSGELSDLITDDKSNLVGAINEVKAQANDLEDIKQDKIDNDLETTSKEVVGAINELNTDVLGIQDELEDIYTKTESDNRFVHLTGNETISDTKTFTSVPLSDIDASANKHLVNRQTMTTYTYDKTTIDNKINELTQIYSFETEQNFLDWLGGTFDMKGGVLPADLKIGNKILIQEEGKQNYQVASVPVTSIADFKVIVEDNKDASEIRFDNNGTDLTSDNVEDVVKEVNDKTNAKSQISELPDLTILTTDWIADGDIYYYNYSNENFIDITKQSLVFKLNISDADYLVLRNEDVIFFNPENEFIGGIWYEKIKVNKLPSLDLDFKVMLYTYTDEIVEAGTIPASSITYNNSISSLIATNVQNAIDELASVKVGGNTIYGGTIVDNLNTISKSGFYTCYRTATGVPLSNYSWAVIHINSNVGTINATQMAFDYVGVNMYKRTKTGSVWGGWQQIARWEDVVSLCLPKSGGTINGILSVTGNINPSSDIQMQGDGNINLDGGTVKYVPTPTNSNDVANKEYVDSLSVYDKVIRTQTEFETLIASPTWLDAKSVAFVGDGGTLEFVSTGTINLGITIPSSVKDIKGFNNAIIKIENIDDDITAIGYSTLDINNNSSFENIKINISTTTAIGIIYGVRNVANIKDCVVNFSGRVGRCFGDCYNIINSSANGLFEGESYGFYNCNKITNSNADIHSDDFLSVGFYNCSQICNNTSKGVSELFSGYGYMNCSYGSNNKDLGSTSSATNSVTKWSTETND